MSTILSSSWQPSLMQGLKMGGLMNEALEKESTFKQGRHHFMTAINQILECSLTLEQTSRFLQAANIGFSKLNFCSGARYIIPLAAAFLTSRDIKILHISEIANFVQEQIGRFCLAVMLVSTVALVILGQSVMAGSALIYLGVGWLDRKNIFPLPVQNALQTANFFIGNFAGLYLGGNLVRVVCSLNLILPVVKKVIEHQAKAAMQKDQLLLAKNQTPSTDITQAVPPPRVSVNEFKNFNGNTHCQLRKNHVHITTLPPVSDDIKIEDILTLSDDIDWVKHEHVIKGKLSKDKRWLEVEQFKNVAPIDYFKRNLKSLVNDIKNKNILQGKPENYDMLEYYCRYIAQDLKNQDDMTQADMLMALGIDGGEYCGVGKFGIVEEVYESLLLQGAGLSLNTRIFANLQLERQRVCQAIYFHLWKTNPFIQLVGYLSEVNAIHNINLFTNFVQAGPRFGVPHQAAKNDSTALFNPLTHYMAYSVIHKMDGYFWKGTILPQCFFSYQSTQGKDWWKAWKWQINTDPIVINPYDENAILDRLNNIIGTSLVPKTDIYLWWVDWVERQMNLSDDQKDDLIDELQATPQKDSLDNFLPLTFMGEPFEINGKIQSKFLKIMLIEMGVFEKPLSLEIDLPINEVVSSNQDYADSSDSSINHLMTHSEWTDILEN